MAAKVKTQVKQSEIAVALGVSEPAVSKMVKNGMPTDSIESAKIWRESRPHRRVGKKERNLLITQAVEIQKESPVQIELPQLPENASYDSEMVSQACVVTKSAFEAYKLAITNGNPVLIAAAIKNWGEAGKVAGVVRERFLDLQEREKKLIGIDEVLFGVASEVSEWRRMLLSLGAELAGSIPPEYSRAVDAKVDKIMQRTAALEPMARSKFEGGEK